ncbi:MAG TPA: response regulator, partial [Hyphomicrobiaceae bacterium]|nr:response regulator [Hyphomicrobiaceae bacterium]
MDRSTEPASVAALPDNAPHALVVDDDQRIRDLLTRYLMANGFRVTPTESAAAARAAMQVMTFDIVVLDVMMPGENGLDFARDLKSRMDIPICMLTARSETGHRIDGLEAGVDDYLPKPFEPRELLLRLQNILRRGPAAPEGNELEIRMGDLVFQLDRGELRRGDEIIRITERERDLLRQFARQPGSCIARHELASDESTGSERAIDVQINRLRRKIEADPSNPNYLQTVRGKGYILYI